MAIKLEVCSVIVPIEKIREKLGNDDYENYYSVITDITWHDDYLFRDGCMNSYDLGDMLGDWEDKGFEILKDIDGEKHWQDVCVVNSGLGPSRPCDWIEYDAEKNIVWLKGCEPGEIIGPKNRSVFSEQS